METLSEKADKLEQQQIQELENTIITKSLISQLETGKQPSYQRRRSSAGVHLLMGEDPRLPKMPEKPTLIDFIKLRFSIGGQQHLLQSARHAQSNNQPEKVVLSCLLHDLAVSGFIRSDHGYWGAALIEPYVDEEVSWAVRMHQCCRFFADPDVGYEYPEQYVRMFGEGYRPEPYIEEEYKRARKHKWYMSARLICMNDYYAFDPNISVAWDEFEDVLGRGFKEPEQGLGNDNTSASHMWRTLRRPSNAL